MDGNQFLNALAAQLAPLVVSGVGLFAAWLAARLASLQGKKAASSAVIGAAARGAGVAYLALLRQGGNYRDPDAVARAIGHGVEYVLAQVPASVKKVGQSDAGVESLVRGQLGTLLAQDPNVKLPGAGAG
ncbi:hypothetical protein UFOVP326_53 [uncultured Caudovirales phage]|uniref:Holin n=1 Tax=uncultured Caudovirales phage TaxID=2100421 RepID=A0A6J5LXN0_9CAUD|nr:hypothetical protein UFOVP326_53 [uncultured Caudovirales phage]